MFLFNMKGHLVEFVPLNARFRNILSKYNNKFILYEYDEFGKPLTKFNKNQSIFCSTPDYFWSGWVILDKDVIFKHEDESIKKILGS